jgi:SAM-dependent methyltransferase
MPLRRASVQGVDVWDRIRDDIPANRAYAGHVAEAYDTWMPWDAPYQDAGYFRRAIEAGSGPALELACGTGRLLVRYVAAGLEVDGVDSAQDMLAICARNAATAGVDVTLHHADVTTLDLDRRYATIYNPAGSFMLHDDVSVARAALVRWNEHLLPGGRLCIMMSVPRTGLDAQYEWRVRRSATRPSDGVTFVAHEAKSYDLDAQIETILNRHELYDPEGALVHTFLRRSRLRWWEQPELEAALRDAGLVDVHSDGTDDAFVTVGAAPA